MKITIVSDGEFLCTEKTKPEVGRTYNLEDAANGTDAQNKAFHALIGEYWKSGAHSYDAKSFPEFKNQIKRALGAGFECFVFVTLENGKAVIRDAKTKEDIPAEIRRDPDFRKMARGRLKSWADYTKKERRDTMDRLIAEMMHVGVKSKKFDEILEGMGALFA